MTLSLLFLFFAIACENAGKSVEESAAEQSDTLKLSNDFIEFYTAFHADSTFQVNHILFPMKGLPVNAEKFNREELRDFRWTEENWELHRLNPLNNEQYQVEFRSLGPDFITETVTHNTGLFSMQRNYSKSDAEWILIYYEGMNKTRSGE